MNKSTSLYLDILRVFAAFGVLLNHANFPWFSNNLFPGDIGHKFVALFFVLSGYVIAFTVDKKNKGSIDYLASRFSRLYSVVIPALIFTYLLDFIGSHLNAEYYKPLVDPDRQVIRFFLNFTFLQQIWTLCIKPSSNVPFWSIAYEFWYYMIFWVFYYYKGVTRVLGISAMCLFIGLKILIMFPIWILGVVIYKLSGKQLINKAVAGVVWILTVAAILILTFWWDFSIRTDNIFWHNPILFFSNKFIFDSFYGLIVAINIYCFNAWGGEFQIRGFIEKAIRYLSSITFTLYLFHFPILAFIGANFHYNRSSYAQIFMILVGVVLLVSVLAIFSERQRGKFKKMFEKIFGVYNRKPV